MASKKQNTPKQKRLNEIASELTELAVQSLSPKNPRGSESYNQIKTKIRELRAEKTQLESSSKKA